MALHYLIALFQILFPILSGPQSAGGGGGTTPTYSTQCNGQATSQNAVCNYAVRPSSGNALVGIIWVGNGGSVTSVHDGTGTDGSTGANSTWYGSTNVAGTFPTYCNATNFCSVLFYTCNYAGSNTTNATINLDSSRSYYVAGAIVSGNSTTTTACNDGYNKAQATTTGTTFTSGTVTTTNSADLMLGLLTNNTGAGVYSAGTDGAAHSYTIRQNTNNVAMVESLVEAGTGTYSASATYTTSATWNAEVFAVK